MSSVFDDIITDDGTTGGFSCEHGEIIHGDAFSVLEELPENEFHAIVCDPPYNFDGGFMQREWDDIGSPKQYQKWCQTWGEKALKTLKPGGHVIAFSGNRSHHRLFSGIEDAGYEIRDTITWHYGDGFPKGPKLETWLDGKEAEQWGDWRSMLKPATEFAVLARSPLDKSSSTQNQVEHGVANLNIEACRIPTVGDESLDGGRRSAMVNSDAHEGYEREWWDDEEHVDELDEEVGERVEHAEENGRYPPNIALDPVMAEVMNLLAGDVSGVDHRGNCNGERDGGFYDVGSDSGDNEPNSRVYADSGGASRFFYCPKAPKSERTHDGAVDNDHETVKPIDLMEWLVKMVTAEGQKVLDPFLGSGTTILAADNVDRECVGIEMNDEYVEIAEQRWDEHTS